MRLAALALAALALTGCETSQEKSAKLERAAKLADRGALSQRGLSITRESAEVRVLGAAIVRDSEGAAAIVTLSNSSSRALRTVPIAITVRNAAGVTVFQNDAPGLEAALVSVPSLAPHSEVTWVDDQVPANGAPASATARVGEAPAVAGSLPQLGVDGLHLIEDPSSGMGAAGAVSNRSQISQRNLVVFVVARRAGQIVAGARAVLPEVPAGSSTSFQAFFIGDPHGAQLQAIAPPTTLG